MDKASRLDIPLDQQRLAWNLWNAEERESRLSAHALRMAGYVEAAVAPVARPDLEILEVGCGTGWLCTRLADCGRVTGVDLSDEVLARAQRREPRVRFIAGDFMSIELPPASFDVVVTLDTLSHVADQAGFVERIAELMRPSASLILCTQNGPVLDRCSDVPGPQPGQLRHWVDHRALRALLTPWFHVEHLSSIEPRGHLGLLRLFNSVKLNALAASAFGADRIESLKERRFLGSSLVVSARRR